VPLNISDANLFETKLHTGWMFGVIFKAIADYEESIAQYPNIQPGQEFDGYRGPGEPEPLASEGGVTSP